MFRLPFVVTLLMSPSAIIADQRPASSAKPKWVVFYADNYCVLIRPRSGSAGGLRIESRPFETYHELQFLLPRDGRGSYMKPGHLSVSSSRSSTPDYISVNEFPSGNDRWVRTRISNEQLAQAVKDQSLGVTIPDKMKDVVSTAGLAKALLAVKKCEDGLAIKWGAPKIWSVDPVPTVDPQAIFRSGDYPTGLLNARMQGDVRLLVKIGASGDVLACRSINSVHWKQFAEIVCKVLRKRLKFTPARDANGKAMESYYVPPRVRFMLAN